MKNKASEYLEQGMWVKCEINKSRANYHSPLQFSFSFEIPVAFVCSKAKGKEAEEEEEYLAKEGKVDRVALRDIDDLGTCGGGKA